MALARTVPVEVPPIDSGPIAMVPIAMVPIERIKANRNAGVQIEWVRIATILVLDVRIHMALHIVKILVKIRVGRNGMMLVVLIAEENVVVTKGCDLERLIVGA